MKFRIYEQGKELLNYEENNEWLDMVTCLKKEEEGYNIFVFLVLIDNEKQLVDYYEKINASIAAEFQTSLDKSIEKWNVYLIFECCEKIRWEIKQKIEQNKYSTRKIVWDCMKKEEYGEMQYIDRNLFDFELPVFNIKKEISVMDIIKENDENLFEILNDKESSVEDKIKIYLGGEKYE